MNAGHSWKQSDIEHIVSLVVDRLIGADTTHPPTGQPIARKFPQFQAPSNGSHPPSQPSPTKTPPPAQPNSHLALSERLITLDTLRDRLAGIKSVGVGPQAIVTPAVRDELKDRGITLSTNVETSKAGPLAKLTVLACGDSSGLDTWNSLVPVQTEADPQRAVARGVNLVRQSGLAVLLCKEAPAAACLANRNTGIRALAAPATAQLESAMRSIGANLVVVDPETLGGGQIEDFLQTVARNRGLSAPAWWKE